MWSDTSFSFTNDLLTAPVYKRLVVSLLRSPTSSNKVQGVSCSAPVTADSDCHSITAHTHAGSIRTSCITVTKPQSLASTTTNHIDTADENLVELASDAAAGIFSSSAVADLDRLLPASGGLGLNLPIRASLSREQLTLEEQAMLDTQFLAAAKSESLLKMAEALDAGADINAVDPKTYQTALQIGITKETCCLAVRFLLQYKNVNFHVRDATGANLLHHAVNRNCGDCTQNLLDVGISMTDKDCFGFPALKVAIEKSYGSARPLLVMLRHATSRGFKRSFIIALHSSALYEQCLRYSHPHPMNYVPRDLELSMRLLIRFGWPLMSYVKTAEPLLGLLKEPSLLEELTSQRETLEHIRAKHPMWDEVLLAATKGAKANTRVVLALLRAGIEYQHVMTEIRELATKEQDSTLLGFLDRSHTSWYWSENDATELIMRENSYVFPILELDAVETQIAHRRSEQRAKEEETQGLQLALTALQHLRHANRLFEEDAWKDPLPTSLMQAVL